MKKVPFLNILFLALSLILCESNLSAAETGSPQKIDRKTFSMLLPSAWTEDTKDDMYDANSFVMFENEDSCLFIVFIGKKSAGMSTDVVFEKQTQAYSKKMTESQTVSFDKWMNYKGKGATITGKIGGAIRYQSSIFVFENGDNVCAIIQAATPADFKKYATDYETVGKSFVLK